MNRILLTLATASIFVVGCGGAALDQGALAPAPSFVEKAPQAQANETKPAEPAKADVGGEAIAEAAGAATGARMPGDFVVYRFSGAFRKAPLTLTEKVVARSGAIVTIDFIALEGDHKE